jgi:hypothetical protein
MLKQDFIGEIMELPLIDDHTHFERYDETHGYNMPRFIYHVSYANIYAGYLTEEERALMDDEDGDAKLQFDVMLKLARFLRFTRCGALIEEICARMGAPLEEGKFDELNALYAARDRDSIKSHEGNIRAYVCNSAGHPMYGGAPGLARYLRDDAAPPDAGMHRVLTINGLHSIHCKADMDAVGMVAGIEIANLSDWEKAVSFIINGFTARGIVGFKELYLYFRPNDISKPDTAAARHEFDAVMRGASSGVALMDYLMYKTYEIVEGTGLAVQVHTGCLVNGGESAAKLMSLQRFIGDFPGVSFDLLHLNYPKLEDYLVLLRSCPNSYGNCTWVTSVDRCCTEEYVRRAIDSLPPERTIYLGTDRHCAGEGVGAVADMSMRILGESLWRMVERNELSAWDALEIAGMWVYGNPRRLFALPV